MSRAVRIEYSGATYHVMCRGNNGQKIFLSDEDRKLFLKTLGEVCNQTGWRIHAYVLMNNHYHLLLETPEGNLVSGMRWFQQTYTQRYNRQNGRTGHLYQGRYKAAVVQAEGGGEYFRTVSTYIHLNPFRAKIAGGLNKPDLASYPWSSYPCYTGNRDKAPDWLHRDRVYESWGLSEKRGAARQYMLLLKAQIASESEPRNRRAIEEAYKELRRGWCVGDIDFKQKLIGKYTGAVTNDNLRSDQRIDHGVRGAERLLKKALKTLEVREDALKELKNTDLRKQGVAWLLKTQTTVTGIWIAERLNMGHRTNASRAISRFRQGDNGLIRKMRKKVLQCTG